MAEAIETIEMTETTAAAEVRVTGMIETIAADRTEQVETTEMTAAADRPKAAEVRAIEMTEMIVADKAAQAETTAAAEDQTVRHFPSWRQSRIRRIRKNATIRKRKEINLRSSKMAAARARRTRKECSSVLLKNRQNRRNTTNQSL